MADEKQDLFKEEFKRYKRRSPAVDLSDVVDLRHPERFNGEVSVVAGYRSDGREGPRAESLGLRPPQYWKIYQFTSVPGLIVIPNPFQDGCQHRWVRESLVSYPCKPNVCNLDAHVERRGRGEVWPGDRADGLDTERATKKAKLSKDDTLYKLRWVTLGYHYDWNTKEYHSYCRSPFPGDLAELSRFTLEVAGFPGFVPEAAIINYYHLDSTLSGHTDHSERDLSLPLLSISFGQSAIFLIGGRTRAVRPKSLLLNSGDVVIMSGDSRLAYHGVPRILPQPSGAQLVPDCLSMEALRQCVAKGRRRVRMDDGGTVCCVCGRPWREEEKCGEEREVQHGIGTPDDPKGSEEAASFPAFLNVTRSSSKNPGNEASAEVVQLLSDSEHTSPSASGHEPCLVSGDGKVLPAGCLSCEEMVHCWPLFASYLTVSRINANIRQVVSENDDFD